MLIKRWGAEKVVESLLRIFPGADLYTLIYDEKQVWESFPREKIHPNCMKLKSQRIYNLLKKQRFCLPFMKVSVESLDFSQYDWVVVSSSGFAHGLKTEKNTQTLIYYHAPARYMWDWTHEYRKEIGFDRGFFGFLYLRFLSKIRLWDYEVAQKNDILLANSYTTQGRIQKYYRRESQVLFPPVETKRFAKKLQSLHNFPYKDYYIILSALSEFKRLDIAIQAFSKLPDTTLVIIGNGDYRTKLESIASSNTHFVGAQFGDDLVSLVQQSRGLIFPGEEDFWIVPIEVMAAGKPIFALRKWGLTETVLEWETWEFFENPNGSDFIEKFQTFHKNNLAKKYKPEHCRKQAEKFSEKVFEEKIKTLLATGSS